MPLSPWPLRRMFKNFYSWQWSLARNIDPHLCNAVGCSFRGNMADCPSHGINAYYDAYYDLRQKEKKENYV